MCLIACHLGISRICTSVCSPAKPASRTAATRRLRHLGGSGADCDFIDGHFTVFAHTCDVACPDASGILRGCTCYPSFHTATLGGHLTFSASMSFYGGSLAALSFLGGAQLLACSGQVAFQVSKTAERGRRSHPEILSGSQSMEELFGIIDDPLARSKRASQSPTSPRL